MRDVFDEVADVSGTRLAITESGRRAGDPPELAAAAAQIQEMLHWTPQHQDLTGIVATDLAWGKRLLRQPMA